MDAGDSSGGNIVCSGMPSLGVSTFSNLIIFYVFSHLKSTDGRVTLSFLSFFFILTPSSAGAGLFWMLRQRPSIFFFSSVKLCQFFQRQRTLSCTRVGRSRGCFHAVRPDGVDALWTLGKKSRRIGSKSTVKSTTSQQGAASWRLLLRSDGRCC